MKDLWIVRQFSNNESENEKRKRLIKDAQALIKDNDKLMSKYIPGKSKLKVTDNFPSADNIGPVPLYADDYYVKGKGNVRMWKVREKDVRNSQTPAGPRLNNALGKSSPRLQGGSNPQSQKKKGKK